MTATVFATVTAFFEKICGENHKAVVKIEINAFNKFWFVGFLNFL